MIEAMQAPIQVVIGGLDRETADIVVGNLQGLREVIVVHAVHTSGQVTYQVEDSRCSQNGNLNQFGVGTTCSYFDIPQVISTK